MWISWVKFKQPRYRGNMSSQRPICQCGWGGLGGQSYKIYFLNLQSYKMYLLNWQSIVLLFEIPCARRARIRWSSLLSWKVWLTDEQTARNGLLDVQIFTATLLSIKYYSVSSCYSDDLMIMTTRITGKVGGGVIGYLRRSHGRNQHIQEARRAFSYCISSLFIFHFVFHFNFQFMSNFPPIPCGLANQLGRIEKWGKSPKVCFSNPPWQKRIQLFCTILI